MSQKNAPFFLVGDYIFSYAYPISFIGALFYSIASVVNIDPSTVVANKNVSVILNILVGTCGVISLFAFFRVSGNVPVIGNTLLPNGNDTIKTNLVSDSTY
jgi:hypothetical protein